MTALDLDVIQTALVVSVPAPTTLVAALDPPLVLTVAPVGATLAVTVAQAGVLTAPAAQGPPGPAGRDGLDGGNRTYSFTFPQPITDWPIPHGLGRFPSVTVVDSAGSVIDTAVIYQDANNVLVSFNAPVVGTAYLN